MEDGAPVAQKVKMEDGAPAAQKIETDEESVVFLDPIQKDSSVKRKVLDKGIWIAGSGGCGKTVLVLRITEYSQLCDDYHPRKKITDIIETNDQNGEITYKAEGEYVYDEVIEDGKLLGYRRIPKNNLVDHVATVFEQNKTVLNYGKYTIDLQINDLAVQSEYYSYITRFNTVKPDFVILVYDVTSTQSLESGIQMVKMFIETKTLKKNTSIILVGNKTDLLGKKINGKTMQEPADMEIKRNEARKIFKIAHEFTLSALLFDESAITFYQYLINLCIKKSSHFANIKNSANP